MSVSILCLQAFNLAPKNGSPTFGNSHFDRCRHSPNKKIMCHLQQNLMLFLVKSNPEFSS